MIFVEDKSDQYILQYFDKPSKKIYIADGKQDVVKKIKKEDDTIGIIDFDNGIDKETEGMEMSEDLNHIKVFSYKKSRLVVIYPRLQEWLVSACSESASKPSAFKLPDKIGEFHKAINKEILKDRLLKLLIHLKKNSNMFREYKSLIDKLNHKG